MAKLLAKLEWLLALCDTLDVRTTPTKLADTVWVVPLLGWYSSNLDGQEDPESLRAVAVCIDAHLCKWRADTASDLGSDDTAHELTSWNEPFLERSYVRRLRRGPRTRLWVPHRCFGAFIVAYCLRVIFTGQSGELGSNLAIYW